MGDDVIVSVYCTRRCAKPKAFWMSAIGQLNSIIEVNAFGVGWNITVGYLLEIRYFGMQYYYSRKVPILDERRILLQNCHQFNIQNLRSGDMYICLWRYFSSPENKL